MAKHKLKLVADELNIKSQEIIDFLQNDLSMRGLHKNSKLDDNQYNIVKARFSNLNDKPAHLKAPSEIKDEIQLSDKGKESLKESDEQSKEVVEKERESKESNIENIEGLTEEQVKRTNVLNKATSDIAQKEGTEFVELSDKEKDYLAKADKNPGGYKKYLEYLETINKRLNGLLKDREKREQDIIDKQNQKLEKIKKLEAEIETEKKQLSIDINQLEIEKAEFSKTKETFQPKIDELNKREQELNQLAIDIKNKEYSSIILALTKSMNKAQSDIQEASVEWIEKLADVVKEYQKHVEGTARQRLELEKEKGKLAEDKDMLDAEKTMLSMQKEAIVEEIEAKKQREYGKRIEELKRQNTTYDNKYRRQIEQREEDNKIIDTVLAVLGSTDKDEIIKILEQKEKEITKYKRLAEDKIDKSEYETVVAERDTALKINANLKKELSSERIEAVRQQARDTDALMNNYNNTVRELESAKATVNMLTMANESYVRQIKTLTEESKDPKKAFEFARMADESSDFNNGRISYKTPSSLYELVNYVRKRMATGDEKGENKFYYDESTIKTFIAGLHMSPITILEGISGTGKTSLPVEFIKAITIENDEFSDKDHKSPYRICAIQSGWRDNMDLMGYFNSFDYKYNETDFFKALYLAGLPKYKDTLFLIVLDEMNLSHPEHYFADFLSLLEITNLNNRILTIKAPNKVLPERIKNGLLIPENVRFIGTANNDETTNSFAPKTYDRSNVIEMPRNKDEGVKPTTDKFTINYQWFKERFKEAEELYEEEYDKFYNFIEDSDLTNLLNEQDIGIGNRFADLQAKKFICVYLACGKNTTDDLENNLAEAVDHLMTSRLLRVIKNKYGIDANKINIFKDNYETIFKLHFNKEPKKAIKFLNKIAKKKQEDE